MKHTSYILNSHPVRPEQIISDRPVLKQITIIIAVVIAVLGLFFEAGLLVAAWIMDAERLVRLKFILHQREERKKRYVRHVLVSLGHEPHRANIQRLLAA